MDAAILRTTFSPLLIRTILTIVTFCSAFALHAQVTAQIGFGSDIPTATLFSPMARVSNSSGNDFSRSNIVFTSAEMAAAGIPGGAVISKLAFHKRNDGATVATASPIIFQIWMNNSTVTPPLTTTPWADIAASHTMVYNTNNQEIPATIGWIEFDITPFVYTGGSLEIATHWDISAVAGSPTTGPFTWEYTAGYETSVVGQISTSAPPNLGVVAAYRQRPNIIFTYTAAACQAPPVAGNAVASVSATCPNVPFTLSLDGNSTGMGQSYQWQYSTDNANWLDIPGATNASTLVSQIEDRYYRALVTCSGQTVNTTNTLLVTTYQPLNGNYTINSNNTTGGTNFANFQDFAFHLSCAGVTGPVVVNVEPGTYTGRVVFSKVKGVSASNTITINGNGQELSYHGTVSAERAAILFDSAQYITIDSLVIIASSGTHGWGIQFTNESHNNTLSNNTIITDTTGTGSSSSNYAGIVASASLTAVTGASSAGFNADNLTITGNTILGGHYGIILVGNNTGGTLATGNVITNNTIRDVGQDGIYLSEQSGAIVRGNDISRPNRQVTSFFRGIYLTGVSTSSNASQNNLLINNRIHDANTNARSNTGSFYGIYIGGADAPGGLENRVVNNLVYNIYGNNTQYGIWSTGSDGNYIYHNTIVLDDQDATSGDARGIYQSTAASNIEIRNNLVEVTKTGSGNKVALIFGTSGSTINSNNNVLWVTPNTAGYSIGATGTTAGAYRATLQDWQAEGYDNASVAGNPQFADRNANNFQPTNSGANNTGAYVGVDEDIFGNTRSFNSPDAGAIEWESAGNDAAISAFIAPTNLPYCDNTLDVIFVLTNTGASLLTSAIIDWDVNGVAQSPVQVTGINLLPGETYNATLGTVNISPNVFYSFSATVSQPSNMPDENPTNNTFTYNNWRSSMVGVYTVNKNQPASATNYQSVQAAADDLYANGICGPVTINVEPGSGPYNEQVTVWPVQGSSQANLVSFNGSGETITFNPTVANMRHIFKVSGASHIVVENFVLNSSNATYGWGLNVNRGASDVVLRNNTVNVSLTNTSSESIGISISDSTNYINANALVRNITVEGNTVNGGYIGISGFGLGGGANDRLQNFRVINNTIRDFYFDGVSTQGVVGVRVEGNDISRPNRPAQATNNTVVGVKMWGPTRDYVVTKNRIHHINNDLIGTTVYSFIGIDVTGNDIGYTNGEITNNLIYSINNHGAQNGIKSSIRQGALGKILHNTIVLNQTDYTGTAVTSAFYHDASTAAITPVDVMNNIFYISRGGTGAKRMIDVSAAGGLTGIASNYNVFWFEGTDGATSVIGRVGANTYPALVDWQGQGQDLNSVVADPQFADTMNHNYKPTNPAINGATLLTQSVGVADDITGATRNVNPDPGAYEFWPTVYVFNGNGNWNDAANWQNNMMPPSPLPAESEVVVDPSGVAILNVPFTAMPGSRIVVKQGKEFVVQGNLTIQ